MDEATSGGWNTSQKRKRFLIATGTEGYPPPSNGAAQVG